MIHMSLFLCSTSGIQIYGWHIHITLTSRAILSTCSLARNSESLAQPTSWVLSFLYGTVLCCNSRNPASYRSSFLADLPCIFSCQKINFNINIQVANLCAVAWWCYYYGKRLRRPCGKLNLCTNETKYGHKGNPHWFCAVLSVWVPTMGTFHQV